MMIELPAGDDIALQVSPVAKHAYDAAVQRDLEFLRAWEDGLFPDICCYLRVRQIRIGNPILVAQRRSQHIGVHATRPSM